MPAVLHVTRTLRFTRPGRLQPWLGPALRGLLARAFKTRVCHHSLAEQQTRWRYCHGCPHMAACPYGQTLEPDPRPAAHTFRGQEEAVRPVVFTLPFPMPPMVRAGDERRLTVTFIGDAAIAHVAPLWQALREAGADPRRGFDPQRTTFDVGDEEERVGPEWIRLPAGLRRDEPVVPRVRVDLTGPLFLRRRDEGGRRHHLAAPSFADLLRASLRTLGGLFRLYDAPLPAEFAELRTAAEAVPRLASDFADFYQERWSNRKGRSRPANGVVGSGAYGPVPAALVEWLKWGGRVHVGTDRVAGAGGWRVSPGEPEA